MGHYALIGAPTPVDDERQRFVASASSAAHEHFKKLIDERIVARQREAIQHLARDVPKQAWLEAGPDSLHNQVREPTGVFSRELQGDGAAKRNTYQSGPFQSQFFDDVAKVVHELVESEIRVEEAMLAAQLIGDYSMRLLQLFDQRLKEFDPPS
jgi:hypothetical protein